MNFYTTLHPTTLLFGFLVAYVMPQISPLIINLIVVLAVAFSLDILMAKKDIVFMILKARNFLPHEMSLSMNIHFPSLSYHQKI
jgi:hypothetical protein